MNRLSEDLIHYAALFLPARTVKRWWILCLEHWNVFLKKARRIVVESKNDRSPQVLSGVTKVTVKGLFDKSLSAILQQSLGSHLQNIARLTLLNVSLQDLTVTLPKLTNLKLWNCTGSDYTLNFPILTCLVCEKGENLSTMMDNVQRFTGLHKLIIRQVNLDRMLLADLSQHTQLTKMDYDARSPQISYLTLPVSLRRLHIIGINALFTNIVLGNLDSLSNLEILTTCDIYADSIARMTKLKQLQLFGEFRTDAYLRGDIRLKDLTAAGLAIDRHYPALETIQSLLVGRLSVNYTSLTSLTVYRYHSVIPQLTNLTELCVCHLSRPTTETINLMNLTRLTLLSLIGLFEATYPPSLTELRHSQVLRPGNLSEVKLLALRTKLAVDFDLNLLGNLVSLTLPKTFIGQASVTNLGALTNLRTLADGTGVLEVYPPRLRALRSLCVDPARLEVITELKDLERVTIELNENTDQSRLTWISKLTRLETLDIRGDVSVELRQAWPW